MENKKIYIVMKSTGQYEDSFESPYKAFTSKEKAFECVEKLRAFYDELDERYMQIDIDVQGKIRGLFDRYLQDTHKNLFEAYKKAMDAEQYDESFNWDAFYDMESDFNDNKELIDKYMDICNVSDYERKCILTHLEYEDHVERGEGLPFFYVSHNVLDLEE